jgi:hypothetical protein
MVCIIAVDFYDGGDDDDMMTTTKAGKVISFFESEYQSSYLIRHVFLYLDFDHFTFTYQMNSSGIGAVISRQKANTLILFKNC